MKIHGHIPLPPTPPQLLPARTNANAVAASQANATGSATGATTAWQNAVAGTLPAIGTSGQAIQPVAARQSSASSRGYVLSAPSKQPTQPVTTIDNLLNGDPAGDVPYTRGSIIDIQA